MAASRRIAGLVFLLAASLSGRARTLPAHVGTLAGSFRLSSLPRASQHAYPAALFLSGLVVGAALVALVRWPPARVVTTAAASKTQPESFAADQAPPAPAVSVTTPDRKANDHPVATKGTGATTTQHSVASASTEASPSSAPASYRGSLVINSRPQGADVFLNGRRAGTTPLVLDDVPVGSRAVRVVLKGHESWSRAFNVVANQRTTVVATLEEERDNRLVCLMLDAA
jgi:hypothetical protein